MLTGVLVCESLRSDATLDTALMTVTGLQRVTVTDPAADQPAVWTMLEFRAAEDNGDTLSTQLAAAINATGPWYCDFASPVQVYVVFAGGRVFHYQRGDTAGRAAAQAHGRTLDVPDQQLDWPI